MFCLVFFVASLSASIIFGLTVWWFCSSRYLASKDSVVGLYKLESRQSALIMRRLSCLLFYSLLYIYIFCDQVTRMGLFSFGFINYDYMFLLCIGTWMLHSSFSPQVSSVVRMTTGTTDGDVIHRAFIELINVPTVLPT